MAERLTDKLVRCLAAPETGNRITYDLDVKGFGVRITSAGARAFVVNYRAAGRERRLTIGSFPDWTVAAARERAKLVKREVDQGSDPMAERHMQRAAPTVADLADRFETEHLSKRRETTARDYRSILALYIRPHLGPIRVADLRHSDVEKMHTTIARTAPYRANRTIAVLSKMLSLAVKWEMRSDNPAQGIEREPEQRRERFLSPAEIIRLATSLDSLPSRSAVNAIRMLLLTGARRGELLAAKWSEFDLEAGVWTKPSGHTKQARTHRIPLSGAARTLLQTIRATAKPGVPHVFVGRTGLALTDIKATWARACQVAGLVDIRLHDLRHTYASILASSGLSLPIIGALLGHTQAGTTQRYAHLLDDPLRAATERVGTLVSGARR